MTKIELHRDENCVRGLWSIPDPESDSLVYVKPHTMLEHYVSEEEGKPVDFDKIRRLQFKFTPDNPMDSGKHGIPGKLEINYDLIE